MCVRYSNGSFTRRPDFTSHSDVVWYGEVQDYKVIVSVSGSYYPLYLNFLRILFKIYNVEYYKIFNQTFLTGSVKKDYNAFGTFSQQSGDGICYVDDGAKESCIFRFRLVYHLNPSTKQTLYLYLNDFSNIFTGP